MLSNIKYLFSRAGKRYINKNTLDPLGQELYRAKVDFSNTTNSRGNFKVVQLIGKMFKDLLQDHYQLNISDLAYSHVSKKKIIDFWWDYKEYTNTKWTIKHYRSLCLLMQPKPDVTYDRTYNEELVISHFHEFLKFLGKMKL